MRIGLTPSRRQARCCAARGWMAVREGVESPVTLPDLRQVAVELGGIGMMAPPLFKQKQLCFAMMHQPSCDAHSRSVAQHFRIGLCDPVKADWQNLWNSWRARLLRERPYVAAGQLRQMPPRRVHNMPHMLVGVLRTGFSAELEVRHQIGRWNRAVTVSKRTATHRDGGCRPLKQTTQIWMFIVTDTAGDDRVERPRDSGGGVGCTWLP